MSDILKIEREGRVAIIVLNRPEVLNAMDPALRLALLEALSTVGRERETGAVVLAAEGRAFCAGADLKNAAATQGEDARRTPRALIYDFNPIIETISRMDKPVIAAVQGGAVGIGMSFALACDLLVMAKGAYLLPPFLNIGLIPDGAGTWALVQRIGYARAFEILAEAQRVPAETCVSLGIANRLVEPEELRANAVAWAATLADRPPIAMYLTKRAARLATTTGLSEFLSIEAELQGWCAVTEDAKEAITAFAQKRKPEFKGR